MEVILLERVEHLGQMGDVVRVKPGYARNFLLPRGKAVRANEDSRKRFEAQRAQLEAVNLQRRAEAEAVAVKAEGTTVVLIRQAGEAGQLYGSVAARDVADAVTAAGLTIAKHQVRLQTPIKTLGLHKVTVSLHPEVAVTVIVNVARSPDEAEIQARTGGAVVRGAEAEEEPEAAEPVSDEAGEVPAAASGDDASAMV
jgi:large subunit ribosomal protein L9